MAPRSRWFVGVLFCLSCFACPVASAEPPSRAAAELFCQQGQRAVERGDLAEAERLYRASLAADPGLTRSHLGLASICIGRDDLAGACTHLARYLDGCPEQRLVRMRYADLLLRTQRLADARTQFERCLVDMQEQGGGTGQQLIHCHRRLMEIAETLCDAYAQHFHRGVGVYLVARARTALPDLDGRLPAESLFFKAAAELNLAHAERPGEAGPCWYIYEVWTSLGQRQPALRWLRAADAAAAYSELTPAERRWLSLARQSASWEQGSRGQRRPTGW